MRCRSSAGRRSVSVLTTAISLLPWDKFSNVSNACCYPLWLCSAGPAEVGCLHAAHDFVSLLLGEPPLAGAAHGILPCRSRLSGFSVGTRAPSNQLTKLTGLSPMFDRTAYLVPLGGNCRAEQDRTRSRSSTRHLAAPPPKKTAAGAFTPAAAVFLASKRNPIPQRIAPQRRRHYGISPVGSPMARLNNAPNTNLLISSGTTPT